MGFDWDFEDLGEHLWIEGFIGDPGGGECAELIEDDGMIGPSQPGVEIVHHHADADAHIGQSSEVFHGGEDMLGIHRRGGFVGEQVALGMMGDLGPCSGERDALLLSDAQVAIGCLAEVCEFESFECFLGVCFWIGD